MDDKKRQVDFREASEHYLQYKCNYMSFTIQFVLAILNTKNIGGNRYGTLV